VALGNPTGKAPAGHAAENAMKTRISFFLLIMLGLLPGRADALYPVLDGFRLYSTVITSADNGIGGVQAVAVLPLEPGPLPDSYSEARIILGGSFKPSVGTDWQNLVRLLSDGRRDNSFKVAVNGSVSALAVQPDKSVIIGGSFTNVSTSSGSKARKGLARLDSNGQLDSFNPVTTAGAVSIRAIALQKDGAGNLTTILVGGSFAELESGKPSPHFARISPAGAYLPSPDSLGSPGFGSLDGEVAAILLQQGNIILAGSFTHPWANLARFKAVSGSFNFDSSFQPAPGGTVRAMAAEANGDILVGGDFPGYLARFPSGGTGLSFSPNLAGSVTSIVVQPDGCILVSETLSSAPSTSRLVRFKSDSPDPSFAPPGFNGAVQAVALQLDGKILAGGDFSAALARFYTGGAPDAETASPDFQRSYGSNPNGALVTAVALQPDGGMNITGSFTDVLSKRREDFVRLKEDWSLDDSIPLKTSIGEYPISLTVLPDQGVLLGSGFARSPDIVNPVCLVWIDSDAAALSLDNLIPSCRSAARIGVTASVALLENGNEMAYLAGDFDEKLLRLKKNSSGAWEKDPLVFPKDLIPGDIYSLAIQRLQDQNGAFVNWILVGTDEGHLLRIDPRDGSLDPSWLFNTQLMLESLGISGAVYSIAVDPTVTSARPKGRVLIGGEFEYPQTVNGQTWHQDLLRLDQDGAVDTGFNVETGYDPADDFGSFVSSIALQTDGSILVGGLMTYLWDATHTKKVPRNSVARLLTSGAVDGGFELGDFAYLQNSPLGTVTTVNLQPDGKLIIGGDFQDLNPGVAGHRQVRTVARFNNNSATQMLQVDSQAQTIGWVRKGTGPELWMVYFEYLADPTAATPLWRPLGIGSWSVALGGWQCDLTGAFPHGLPSGTRVRARGYTVDGTQGGGSLLASELYYYPQIQGQTIKLDPVSCSYGASSPPLNLTLTRGGGAPVQWFAGSGIPVTFSSNGTGPGSDGVVQVLDSATRRRIATIDSGGNLNILGAGHGSITVTQPGDSNYAEATCSTTLDVAPKTLKVTAQDKTRVYQTPNPPLTAVFTGFVTGEDFASAAIQGSPGITTLATLNSAVTAQGYPITVTVDQLSAPNYSFEAVNGTLFVVKSCQEINFPQPGDRTFGDPPSDLQASTCSGLEITLSLVGSDPGVATMSGYTLTILGAGNLVITASQTGSDPLEFEGAPEVVRTLTVHKKGQTITFAPLPPKSRWDPPFTPGASASSGLSVSYQSSDESVAAIAGDKVVIKGAGTAVITARQAGNGNFEAALPSAQPLTVREELVPPLLSLSTLSSGAVTANPVLNLMGSARDASGVASLTVNGADLTAQAGLFSCAIPLAAGQNSIEVTAQDGAGNRETQRLAISFDALAPEIFLSVPADNGVTDQPLFSASGTVTPGALVSLAVNGAQPQTLSTVNGAFAGSGSLQEGVNTIEFSCSFSGRISRVKRSVTLASAGPSLAILEPAEDVRTELAGVVIRGAAGSGAASLTLEAAGKSYAPVLQGGTFQQSIALDHPGAFQVTARLTDATGKVSTVQRNIIRVPIILGDLDGDGRVDIRDAAQALRISLGLDQASPQTLAHGDVAPLVNGVPRPDGVIDSGDVLLLLRKIVGLVDF
jgi:large repetitive protein